MFSSNTSQVDGGYQISRSLRFNSADSAYLNRTPASASSRTTWTWSAWVKRGDLSTATRGLFGAGTASSTDTGIYWTSADKIDFFDRSGGSLTGYVSTNAVFRDPSAWYHIVVVFDSGNATAANRMLIYINNVSQSLTVNNTLPQNTQSAVNNTVAHALGSLTGGSNVGNGYMTEVNFIDGQALTPSSFGQTNAQTGVWEPVAYSGSYGTNGFYLNFQDNSGTTSTTLGKDYSGNGNNWTPNNFSVSAGAGNDSLVDTPTPYGADTGAGGEVRGNYCTWNPLYAQNTLTLSNGNLDATRVNANTSQYYTSGGTFAVSSGKWYWEILVDAIVTSAGEWGQLGIVRSDQLFYNYYLGSSGVIGYAYYNTGSKGGNGSLTSGYGATFTTGDIIGVAFDADSGTITFYKNGVSQGQAFSSISMSIPWAPAVQFYDSGSTTQRFIANFGQRPFAYTAPSGYKALCTQNLPTPAIGATTATQAGKYFNPVLYTGNTTTKSITGVGFQPDFVWIKDRARAVNHILQDAVRTAGKTLISNSTNAETGNAGDLITSFNSDGFTVNTNLNGATNDTSTNGNSDYVAWNWKANGAGSSNTAGSITSTVSANTTSGFSIVTYTAQTSGTGTIGHGLGVAPSMIITKQRGSTGSWTTYHVSLGNTQAIYLNLTSAATTDSTIWNNTSPTSTVFTLGSAFANAGTMVAYCFAEVAGYSAFGSFVGNGSADGPFVFTGFRPKYVLIKCSSNSGLSWVVNDGTRNPSNVTNLSLFPDLSNAENSGGYPIDFCANGFKIRGTGGDMNTNGYTFIYAAFAEFPQKFSLAR